MNHYEAANRARKVDALVEALLALPAINGDVLAIPVDRMEAMTAEQVAEWAIEVAGITAPSPVTWAQTCAAIRIRQASVREAAEPGYDPFEGL